MDVRPGYKYSELGEIPKDWYKVPLGNVSSGIGDGIHATPIYCSTGDYHFINGNNLASGGIIVTEETKTVDHSEFMRHRKDLNDRSILMSINGTIGNLGLFRGEAVVLGKSAAYLNVKGSVSKLFVYHSLQTESVKRQFSDGLTGTTIRNLGLCTIKKTTIPLPPTLAEQEAIAEALSHADALIDSLERLLTKKRQIKKGAMQELLTGKKRLPGFSERWEASPLRRFVRRFIVPMRDKPKCLSGYIPWCRIEDFDGMFLTGSKSGQGVSLETVRAMNLKVYQANTLLVSCSADLGRCAIVTRPLVSNQTFIGLEMDEAISSNLFFYYLMTSSAEELNSLSSGTTISYLSREQFEEFVVFVPLDKKEQTAIATFLSDIDTEITALEAKLSKARQIKQGMMQELLTGRIRLL